jgi:hypothetical protein
MMSKLSHVYIHLGSAGSADACAAVRADLSPLLKALDARDDIRGYRMSLVADQDKAEDELLHHMFDYESVTNRRFPFVYAMLTPHVPEKVNIDEIMQMRGFQRFA